MSDLTTTFTNIANAIRSKTGSSDTMTPSEMPNEIAEIETPMDSINITQNGTYEPSAGRGYNQVIVEVPDPTLKTKTITENGTYNASEDNADGYSQVAVAVEGFKKKSIANTPTDIASFNDGTANPMPSLEISIEPVQSGSGDPSPQNVRPISGWSGANVTDCGVNLFDKDSTTVSNVTYIGPNGTARRSGFKLALPNGNYSFKCFGATVQDYIYVFKNNAGNYINVYYLSLATGRWMGANISVDTGDELYVVAAYENTTLDLNFDLVVVAGTTPLTTYHAYQGSTLSIPFHDSSDNPITVYGGRLNVTTGELTVTMANADLGTLTWTYNTSQYYQRFYSVELQATVKKPASDDTVASAMCSNYPLVSATAIYSGRDKAVSIGASGTLSVADSAYTDATAFKTAMDGVQLVYELATLQTYQLTPTQVTTLLNQNNIFADCGQILEGEYFVTL